MISLDPKYLKPKKVRCEKCGNIFTKEPYSSVYSTRKGGLVTLCDSCAKPELQSGNISMIIY